jgi:hypothetical protein
MLLDPENGLYVFEVVLGYKAGNDPQYTVPYILQAHDEEEAEEKTLKYLEAWGVSDDFWIEDLSEPVTLLEFQHMLEENGDQARILLGDLTGDDLRALLEAS